MRRALLWMVVISLVSAGTLAAQTQMAKAVPVPPPGEKEKKAAETSKTKASDADKAEKKDGKDNSEVLAEIQQLRQLIEEQKRQIEEQRAMLGAQQTKLEELEARSSAAPATASSATPAPAALEARVDAVAAAQDDLSKRVQAAEGRIKSIGPFSFSGDLRARFEPFYGGGAKTSAAPEDRNRFRYRLRVNANAKFNDEFAGGFSIASGDPGDPISTNQTMTNFFVRKPILVDKAFLTYTPHVWKPFSVTVGKWGYTWYRTQMVWDDDTNPEGASEQLMWNWKDRVLEHFGVVAFQMPLFEVSGGPDAALFGGQIQTRWKLTDRVKLTADAAFYDYHKADPIAANQNSGLGNFGSGFGGSTFSNFSGTIGGVRAFASKFGILDTILRLDVDTGKKTFPLMAQLDFAQNTRACSNLQAFVAAGATVPFCDKSQRQAYMGEVNLGKTQEKGDMRFTYKFTRIERDSVVSAFNFSDLRQPTNVAEHWIEYFYQAYSNITLGFTGLIGRQLHAPISATTYSPDERWLKRLQFDIIYKF